MQRPTVYAFVILLIGVLSIIGIVALRPKPQPRPVAKPSVPEVWVVRAKPEATALSIHTQGTVAPSLAIDLVAEVAGKAQWVSADFTDGGSFQSGDLLVQIDPRNYEFALVNAQSQVAQAEQVLATERGRARQAQREWRDLKNEEANSLFLRRPQVAAAQAQLEAAKANLDQAAVNLQRTRIHAPFAGRFMETDVDVGQYIAPGGRLARVYASDRMEVALPVTDRQLALMDLRLLQPGWSVLSSPSPSPSPSSSTLPPISSPQVTLRGVIGRVSHQWQGQLVRMGASVDGRNRTYQAIVEVHQPLSRSPSASQSSVVESLPLIVGLFVEAEIVGRLQENVVKLPRSALVGQRRLYTLNSDHVVTVESVQVLKSDRQWVWIQGDLAPGQLVIVSEQQGLLPGTTAIPKSAAMRTLPSQDISAQSSVFHHEVDGEVGREVGKKVSGGVDGMEDSAL